MKRVINVLLAIVLVLCLAGCDTNNTSSGTSSHKHAYTKEEVLIEARCNQDGKVKCECECGNAILKDIGKLAEHKWQDATCVKAKTCVWCGLTEGELAEHSWDKATCQKPQTCKICGAIGENALLHSFADEKCTVCGMVRDAQKEADNCSLTLDSLSYLIEFEDVNNGWGRLVVEKISPKFTIGSDGYIYYC